MNLLIGTLFLIATTCGDLFLSAASASPEEPTPADTNTSKYSRYKDQGDGFSSNEPIEKESFRGPENSQSLPEDAGGFLEDDERNGVREYELSNHLMEDGKSPSEEVVASEDPTLILRLKKRARDAEQACAQWRETNSLKMHAICQEKKRALEALQRDNGYSSQKRVEGG